MPCYTVQLNQVSLPAIEPAILKATAGAMAAEGWRAVFDGARVYFTNADLQRVALINGTLESRDLSVAQLGAFRDLLSRSASVQVVYAQAKRYGWKVKQTGPQQFEVQR